ncbi:hypothetical protein CHELA40_14664 [Chelatococcus asaccharovorans]|nr:hypothetical protein CHELA17_60955 [Chelatococcus asaccharovorans]CAH1679115.1 hypothetical protein CHELA40_14664 [Chelatococcus asaccharovorans]
MQHRGEHGERHVEQGHEQQARARGKHDGDKRGAQPVVTPAPGGSGQHSGQRSQCKPQRLDHQAEDHDGKDGHGYGAGTERRQSLAVQSEPAQRQDSSRRGQHAGDIARKISRTHLREGAMVEILREKEETARNGDHKNAGAQILRAAYPTYHHPSPARPALLRKWKFFPFLGMRDGAHTRQIGNPNLAQSLHLPLCRE